MEIESPVMASGSNMTADLNSLTTFEADAVMASGSNMTASGTMEVSTVLLFKLTPLVRSPLSRAACSWLSTIPPGPWTLVETLAKR